MRSPASYLLLASLSLLAVAACSPKDKKADASANKPPEMTMDFKTWTPIGDPVVQTAAAPDGSMTATVLQMRTRDGIAYLNNDKGPTVSAKVFLWSSTSSAAVAIQLVNWCKSDPSQVETKLLTLTSQPTEYEISRTFPDPNDCVRFQIIETGVSDAVNAWNPRVVRTPG